MKRNYSASNKLLLVVVFFLLLIILFFRTEGFAPSWNPTNTPITKMSCDQLNNAINTLTPHKNSPNFKITFNTLTTENKRCKAAPAPPPPPPPPPSYMSPMDHKAAPDALYQYCRALNNTAKNTTKPMELSSINAQILRDCGKVSSIQMGFQDMVSGFPSPTIGSPALYKDPFVTMYR